MKLLKGLRLLCIKQMVWLVLFLMAGPVFSQIDRLEPPNWWVGFNNQHLQLLVHGKNIGNTKPQIHYKGVTIDKVNTADSPNYLFIDLKIDPSAQPGSFDFVFKPEKGKDIVYKYELKSREKAGEAYQGFNHSDAIYLITPDRFANGDTSNDIDESLREKTINRKDDFGRHGGDIRGIINHLDYIHSLGFTAIWPTPLLINDMPKASYHGYAMTDFYEVDPRFGTLDLYKELAHEMEERGLKLIMDQVENHCGSEHWWMQDLPFQDWVNFQKDYESGEPVPTSNHRRTVNQDLYASAKDKALMSQGWFVPEMPDLNQKNPFMARYLIQNSIWWIETLQLGGIRQDTYPYPDKDFLSAWAGAIHQEFPNFNIVVEEWSTNPLLVAYWQNGKANKQDYKSHVKSAMDFPMQHQIVKALNDEETWGTGLVEMYEGLANDFAYIRPEDLMIFPDNHDMDRIFTQLKENVTLTKMAIAYMAVMPRIFQMYYGTEVLLQNTAKPNDHGLIRSDFPGGWKGDKANAFSGVGLSEAQKDMQAFIKALLNFRKTSEALQEGKTMHFAPENGVYVLSRRSGNETVVLILNKNKTSLNLDLERFSELDLEGTTLKDILSGKSFNWKSKLSLNHDGVLLLTTKF